MTALAMGNKEKSAGYFEEFKKRTGPEWERLTITVVTAAWHTGDAKTLHAYADSFLAALPSDSSRTLVEQMLKR